MTKNFVKNLILALILLGLIWACTIFGAVIDTLTQSNVEKRTYTESELTQLWMHHEYEKIINDPNRFDELPEDFSEKKLEQLEDRKQAATAASILPSSQVG